MGLSDWTPSLETSTASDTITQAKSKRKLCIQTHQKTKHSFKKKHAKLSIFSTFDEEEEKESQDKKLPSGTPPPPPPPLFSFYFFLLIFLSIFLNR